MIAILDYGVGNVRSILNMFKHLGVPAVLTSKEEELRQAAKLILPGVGHFDYGMKRLQAQGLSELLSELVYQERKPILGICLGAQMLTRGSEEGQLPGLGWIAADTKKFDANRLPPELRIPHMGWADTSFQGTSRLWTQYPRPPQFYYVHSFHIVCDRPEDEMCYAEHGYRFVAGVEKENIFGVQFHPEKSHAFGFALLKKFAEL